MKCLVFARRTRKEILRDPLTLIFWNRFSCYFNIVNIIYKDEY